jgi:rhodanese-related sulfurtransferase
MGLNDPRPRSKAPASQPRRRRAQPEAQLQHAVVQHLEWRAPKDCVYFAVPNGGWRSRIEAAILKGLGVVPGIPDLIIIYRGRVHALELKSERGRLSPAQAECHQRLREAGAIVGVAAGIDQALAWLAQHGLLR